MQRSTQYSRKLVGQIGALCHGGDARHPADTRHLPDANAKRYANPNSHGHTDDDANANRHSHTDDNANTDRNPDRANGDCHITGIGGLYATHTGRGDAGCCRCGCDNSSNGAAARRAGCSADDAANANRNTPHCPHWPAL